MRDKLNDKRRLDSMLEAMASIEEFMHNVDSCDSFTSNKILCHAVVYNLQCIGESSYKLSRDFVTLHPDIDWESIEGLRHVLVHDYYSVNLKMIWNIIQKDLPELKSWLTQYLQGAD